MRLVEERARHLVDDEVDAPAAGRFGERGQPAGVLRIEREISAEVLQPLSRMARRAGHQRGAFKFGDLQAHQADARARSLDKHAFARAQRAVRDHGVVHGEQRERQRRGGLEGQALRHRQRLSRLGERILGVARGARAHHPVARCERLRLRARLDDLPGPVHPGHGAFVSFRAAEIAPIEARIANAHQELRGFRLRRGELAHLEPVRSEYGCFHLERSCGRLPTCNIDFT